MKYCKDCRHLKRSFFSVVNPVSRELLDVEPSTYKCQNPKLGHSMVTGQINEYYCERIREYPDQCGPDAKWFEPMETEVASATTQH